MIKDIIKTEGVTTKRFGKRGLIRRPFKDESNKHFHYKKFRKKPKVKGQNGGVLKITLFPTDNEISLNPYISSE